MKKISAFLLVLAVLVPFGLMAAAGDMPAIPLTPETTVPEVSTEYEVPVDPIGSLILSDTAIKMNYKSTAKLTANAKVSWFSEDEGVVTVDRNGNLTAVGVGKTKIMATAADGRVAYCTVRVRYSFIQWIIIIFLFGWLWKY